MTLRERAHEIIFGADTPAGKGFDVLLLLAIVASVIAVCMESVASFAVRHGELLRTAEWTFTAFFSAEYLLRLWCVRRPSRYAWSFYGVVDLLAVLPSYVSLFVPGAQSMLVIRALRLLRIFRIFKLGRYVGESHLLATALVQSRAKITVFLLAVLMLVTSIGAAMYLIEGPENGFTSIPRAMYWAIVTLTTVGYGDIAPNTPVGQVVASVVMVLGYGIIAVPTGIVTAELTQAASGRTVVTNHACRSCGGEGHAADAQHCKHCGAHLERE